MTVNREWAEWKIRFCEDSIRDSEERYSKGHISKEAHNLNVARLTGQMRAPKLLVAVEKGERIT